VSFAGFGHGCPIGNGALRTVIDAALTAMTDMRDLQPRFLPGWFGLIAAAAACGRFAPYENAALRR